MRAVLNALTKLNDQTTKVCQWLGIGFVMVMTALVLVQVFFRYVLNSSFSWTEELARYMMVWTTFIVMPVAFRMGSNVSLDIIYSRLKGKAHFILKILLQLATLFTLFLFFRESLGRVESGMNSTATSMPFKMVWVYVCMPIGFALTALVNIEIFLDSVIHIFENDTNDPEVHHPEFSGE